MAKFNLKRKRKPAPTQPRPEPTLEERLERAVQGKSVAEGAILSGVRSLGRASVALSDVRDEADAEASRLADLAAQAATQALAADATAIAVAEQIQD